MLVIWLTEVIISVYRYQHGKFGKVMSKFITIIECLFGSVDTVVFFEKIGAYSDWISLKRRIAIVYKIRSRRVTYHNTTD